MLNLYLFANLERMEAWVRATLASKLLHGHARMNMHALPREFALQTTFEIHFHRDEFYLFAQKECSMDKCVPIKCVTQTVFLCLKFFELWTQERRNMWLMGLPIPFLPLQKSLHAMAHLLSIPSFLFLHSSSFCGSFSHSLIEFFRNSIRNVATIIQCPLPMNDETPWRHHYHDNRDDYTIHTCDKCASKSTFDKRKNRLIVAWEFRSISASVGKSPCNVGERKTMLPIALCTNTLVTTNSLIGPG